MKDLIVAKHYQLSDKLGGGAYGEIWRAVDLITNKVVAVKIEVVNPLHQQLYAELKIYTWLEADPGFSAQALPRAYHYGNEGSKNIMVMDLLGPSLDALFTKCNKKFSLKTVLMIADQAISRFEFIHSRGLLHRDIKPDNFVIGREETADKVYLIDFGLAKKFHRPNGKHVAYRENRPLTGTLRYVSVNTHLGIDQSRRDDMEALGYLLVYLLNGSVPWQTAKDKDVKIRNQEMIAIKDGSAAVEFYKTLPAEFGQYISYCRALKYEEQPDYTYIRSLFSGHMQSEGFSYDYQYDWN